MKHTYIFTYILLLSCLNLMAQTTDFITGLTSPQGMAFNGNYLYVALPDAGKIIKIDLTADTPKATDVVTGLALPRRLFFNGNDLYIVENGVNKISKINITDTPPIMATDVVTDLSNPQGLLVIGDGLFIAEAGAGKISKIDISVNSATIMDVIINLSYPTELALHGNDLYIADSGRNNIGKIDHRAITPTLSEVVAASGPLSIVQYENEIYILENAAKKVSKFDATATSPTKTDVVTGLEDSAVGMAINDNVIYISEIDLGKIVSTQLSLSTNEGSLTENISLFPNPSSSFIEVSGLSQSDEYIIYNTLGKEVSTGDISTTEKIDVSDLPPGFYILKLGSGKAFRFVRK